MNSKIEKLYSEIIDYNSKNKKNKKKLIVISNITCNPVKEYLNYLFSKNNVDLEVYISDYNNLLNDNKHIKNSDIILVIWDLINITDTFDIDAPILNKKKANEIFKDFNSKLILFLEKNKNKKIYFLKFKSFLYRGLDNIHLIELIKKLNHLLETYSSKKIISIISLDKIYEQLSLEDQISYRDYYNSKMIYNIQYFKCFAIIFFEKLYISLKPKKKLIILDCDNTLWGGVLIDEGEEKVDQSFDYYPGSIYYKVQNYLLSLKNKGILLALCTKNNLQDIKKIFKNKTILKYNDFVSVKANWDDKVTNIKEISKELNLGLNSFIFVDDSNFEINHVKETLPEVYTIQVPIDQVHKYPKYLENEINKLIDVKNNSNEDRNKTKMYLIENKRVQQKSKFKSIQEYINSLGIEIKILKYNSKFLNRTSQLFQKTNQFHSSLKRFNEKDIKNLTKRKNNQIYLGEVSDKFGNSGITLLAHIIVDNKNEIKIDSIIMSCRVFGRELEKVFLSSILKKNYKNFKSCKIKFIKGPKNFLVKEFLCDFGFKVIKHDNFILDLKNVYNTKNLKINCKWN
tara:strand:+ start:170 stop:1879 length:1710 start_codon:yes stop_codon:yes gene_type:complete